MSDYGLFESAVIADDAPQQQARLASRKLEAAIYDVAQNYGRFLLGATGLDEFEDRWHYSKNDIRKTVEPHLLPVTGVMRRVHDALKREFKRTAEVPPEFEEHKFTKKDEDGGKEKEAAFHKGAPFAGYKDFAACVAANKDKGDPEAYCGSIKHKVEDKKSHRLADKTGPEQHLQQTDYHSDADLVPEDNFEGYLDRVDQGAPEKVEHNFHRTDENDWDKTREGAIALDLYQDWARSNGLRVASLDTLQLYSANCDDDEYRLIGAAIQRTAEEDEEDDDESDDEDKDEDEGDDEGDEDEGDEDDDDDQPPWLKDSRRHTAATVYDEYTGMPVRAEGEDQPAPGPSARDTSPSIWNSRSQNEAVRGNTPAPPDSGPPPGAQAEHRGEGGTPTAPTGVGGQPIGPEPGSQAAHRGVSGPYNEPGNELELGTGGGYGGAGFQEGGDWTQSTETTPISSGTQYEVKSGDTLQDIADRSGTDVSTLKTQSGDPNLIVPGEKIDIGEASSPAAAQEAASADPALSEVAAPADTSTATAAPDTTTTTTTDPALSEVGNPAAVTEGTVIESGGAGPPKETSLNRGRTTLGSYFRGYYGTRRLAAEDDEEGGGDVPAQEPPPQDPSSAPPAPGAGAAPQAPPSNQPPVDPNQQPAPLENQPAEDHLLDTANQAVSQMIDRETQEYQQLIDPLSQALQAIQFAQQVEQQSNPLDVTPPQGTVDVGPQDAATGAPQQAMPAMGGAAAAGAMQQAAPPQRLQQQAYRIARHFGMTQDGYGMLIEALGRRHYQVVADAISGLENEKDRYQIAQALADNLFAPDNKNFRHDKFFAAAGVDPGSRLGFNRGRTADAGSLSPGHTLDAFEFPGAKHKPKDALSITPDEITDLTPKKKAGKGGAEGLYNQVKTERGGKGLTTNPSDTLEDFKEMAQVKGLSENAVNRVTQKEMPSIKPIEVGKGGGGGKKKGSFGGGFFTRRVPGWQWDDHLAAYITKSAAPFTCKCGSQFDVPAYYNCRCGAVFNAYPIGSGGDDEGRTASIDMFLCREVAVRPDMLMTAGKEACDYNTGGLTEPSEIEWVEDEDLEHADAPHAPYKNAAIGEDDHHVVYRDGERFCSMCDSLLWDPNVHHCPAKQAARLMFGEIKDEDDNDDENTKPPKDDSDHASTLTPHLKKRVEEEKGSDGGTVEEHTKGEDKRGTGAEYKEKKKSSRLMFGDWTVYDDDDPGHGSGRSAPPDTHVSRPPDDWADRGPARGKGSLWREPIFPSSRR